MGGGGEELFHHSMLCKVENITSRFYMGHLPMITKFNANIDRVMSLKRSLVRLNVVELAFEYRTSTI